MKRTCMSCEYADLCPTGEGVCDYLGVEINAQSQACSYYERVNDDCDMQELDELINSY